MVYCFKPTLDPDSVETAIKNVENNITNLKGTIIKTDKMGRKKLAYDVKKFRDGFYAATYFQLDPEKIKNLKRLMKLNDNVIREMTLRIDDIDELLRSSSSVQSENSQEKRPHRRDREEAGARH